MQLTSSEGPVSELPDLHSLQLPKCRPPYSLHGNMAGSVPHFCYRPTLPLLLALAFILMLTLRMSTCCIPSSYDWIDKKESLPLSKYSQRHVIVVDASRRICESLSPFSFQLPWW